MHHKEIGQLAYCLSKHLASDDDLYSLKIDTLMVHESMIPFNETSKGIRLVADIKNIRIFIEIDSSNKDSDETKVSYFSDLADSTPSLFLVSQSPTLNFVEIGSMFKVLVEVGRGNMCLRTLQSLPTIGGFLVQK